MTERKRFRRHVASTIKGLNNEANSNYSGGLLKTTNRLDEIFQVISKTPISTCSVDCPLFKNYKCTATGSEAPLGENCIAQEHSREEHSQI